MAEIIRLNENTWRIEDGMVRFFVLTGKERALMIDSGISTPDAREIAESITDLPLMLLNTHADPDHISGNGAFDEFYMDPAEEGNYLDHDGKGTILPVKEGDIIDLGGRKLRIIGLAGHTQGSIAVLDEAARILFGGDGIQNGNIYMFGKRRNNELYIKTLEQLLEKHGAEFDTVFPSHGDIPVSPELIPKLISAAKQMAEGKSTGEEMELRGQTIYRHDFGFAAFLFDK